MIVGGRLAWEKQCVCVCPQDYEACAEANEEGCLWDTTAGKPGSFFTDVSDQGFES